MELGIFNNLIEKAIIVLSFNLAIFFTQNKFNNKLSKSFNSNIIDSIKYVKNKKKLNS